ncbi:MAG: radical SAM protein, partial [Desulfobacteraceae bacterium]
MKIALFTVPSSSESFGHEKLFLSEPLGLEYIAAGVENEHDVQIFELRQTDEYEKILIEKVETKKPDIIGCGANTADVMMVTNLFKRIKSLNSKILTVVGGHHATIMPEDFFTEHVDVIVQGNGVKAFRKVCNHHQVNKSFETIENIYYKKNGEICYTHREELQSLDDIPFPARHLTSDFRYKYKQPVFFGTTPVALVMGSTGCPYKCKFCGIARVSNNKMISRSIESIIKEISGLKEESIMWVDDEFLIKHKRALAIAEAIEKSGIKKNYWFYGRSSNIVKHPECIEVWSKIGLKFVMIGLESHREADLTEVGKATTKSLNEEAVKICHRYNVKVKG